jgi:hypothetical protein
MWQRTLNIQNKGEKITFFTPLGIRFWDRVQNRQISNSLIVTARSEENNSPVTQAFRTTSGIFAFHGLPGLHDAEYPDENFNFDTYPTRRFFIEVIDMQQQFLPVIFRVRVPMKGIFPGNSGGSPPENTLPGFYLFSAPTRSVLPGLAVIRGLIKERVTDSPASYAVLEIRINGKKWYGIADKQGSVSILFPYPKFISTLLTSPPGETVPLPFHRQKWNMTIVVRYEPETLTYPHNGEIPELRSIFKQKQGIIWSTTELSVYQLSSDLTFGHEFILRTNDLTESIFFIDTERLPS